MPEDWGRGRAQRFPGTPGRRREPLRGGGSRGSACRGPPPPHCRWYLPKNNSGPPGREEPPVSPERSRGGVPSLGPEGAGRAGKPRRPSGEEAEEEEFPVSARAAGSGPQGPSLGRGFRGRAQPAPFAPVPRSGTQGPAEPPAAGPAPPRVWLIGPGRRAERAGRRRRLRWAGRRPARVRSGPGPGPGPAGGGRWRPTWITASAKP